MGVGQLAALTCGVLASMNIGPAKATDYNCFLPTVTTSTIEKGNPTTETQRDESVKFRINVARDDEFALIDGLKFSIVRERGSVTFFGVVSGAAVGLDVITVYSRQVTGGLYAVEFRQVTILGNPIASQNVGVCVPLL